MKNRYHLSRKENAFLAKKRWAESIYCGMKMENRNVTFPQTQTILNGINASSVGLDDIQAILNMRDAWQYVLAHIDDVLDISYLCKVQENVARREALAWGELRTGSIGISGVAYVPPVPEPKQAEKALRKVLSSPSSITEAALNVFAWVARSQLFWDGNKRTALLAANKVLIEGGAGILLVPEAHMTVFSALLSSFYETGNSHKLKNFLYETSILGIESFSSESVDSSLLPEQSLLDTETARTSAWLKAKRMQVGLTQKSLAKATGIAVSTIANIEQKQRKGSDEVWSRIEHYLNSL